MAFKVISRCSANREDHRVILVPHSDICGKWLSEVATRDWYVSHAQYVFGIFGRMKEEVNLSKNESVWGGEVSDLSLYNSKVI